MDDRFKKRLYSYVLNTVVTCRDIKYATTSDVLVKQLVRSSTSIIANYIEGKSSQSRKEYVKYLTHSLKSSNETKVWIKLLKDLEYIKEEDYKKLINETTQISKIFAKSIISLKKTLS